MSQSETWDRLRIASDYRDGGPPGLSWIRSRIDVPETQLNAALGMLERPFLESERLPRYQDGQHEDMARVSDSRRMHDNRLDGD